MSAPAINDVKSSAYDTLSTSDLSIEEFSSWCNPKTAQLSPTTSCWCQVDLLAD